MAKAIIGDGRSDFDPKHLFGSDEEIANRTNTGYEPDRIPQHNAPAFRQIEPSIRAEDLNSPSMERREGDLKFASGKP